MIHKDWLMRQIEALIRFIVLVLLNKEFPGYVIDDESQVSQTDMLHNEIMMLLSEDVFCKG